MWGRVAARANPGVKRDAILQCRQEQTALTRVTSLLLCQRLFRGAERRAPAQAFARHAGEEPRHALAAFQIEPQSRLQAVRRAGVARSAEHTSELQSLMRISYAVFCLIKNKTATLAHNTS